LICGKAEDASPAEPRVPGKDQVPGFLTAVLYDLVYRLGELAVATDSLLPDLEFLPQFLCGCLLVSLTRSLAVREPCFFVSR
jgi:hypothetical protein